MSIRVRVNTSQMIETIEKKKSDAVKEHQAALEKYTKAIESYQAKAEKAAEAFIKKVRNGTFPRNRYGEVVVQDFPQFPNKPVLNTRQLDKDLALLRMSADTTMTVASDGPWACYL